MFTTIIIVLLSIYAVVITIVALQRHTDLTLLKLPQKRKLREKWNDTVWSNLLYGEAKKL